MFAGGGLAFLVFVFWVGEGGGAGACLSAFIGWNGSVVRVVIVRDMDLFEFVMDKHIIVG